MNPEQYARIKVIFAHARELGADERGAYLDQACDGDGELRTEVEELLEADMGHSEDAFDRAMADDEEFEASLAFARPHRIGKYRILSVCGSGGMGTVFEAEQDTPLRRVALKVIQSAAPRPDLLRRFRRETEILARLQHPCIAQIFEAGEFEQDGVVRPYFAMEFVDGAPLLQFAAQQALDVNARLDIFARICDAIHYAHQQGVVHRDLKPDNIFVVESSSSVSTSSPTSAIGGQPKILDFGVASLRDPETQMTKATGAGQLLGSVPYMSPEQATGSTGTIDARSDVYALGVVLFELLTGRLPYEVRHRPLADALHSIRYDEPGRLGSADPGLRGDLETIVGKCLEKDKDRRYESVGTLVDDVRRYRELKPIAARPPTTWYQLKKFTQRNRAMVGGAVTTALALVVGAIVAVLFAVNATHHAGVAREAQTHSDRSAYRANLGAASALFDSDPAYASRILDEIPKERRGWEWQLLSSSLSGLLLEFGEVSRHTPDRFGADMHLLANGEEVVALSADDEFRVWRTRTGEVMRTFAAPESVGVFAASREGNLLAAALEGGRVVTCDPRDDKPVWTTWFESDTRVHALAVAPAGARIAIDRPTEVRFGTPDAWHVVQTGKRSPFLPPDLQFSRDGTQLARQFANVLLFDVTTGEQIGEPMESTQLNWALAIAPDKRRVAIGQMRSELRIFDPVTGKIDFELLGHNGAITDVAYGGGNRLLSASVADGTIRVWDLERREQAAIFDAPKTSRAEFLDEDHILSLSDGRFRLWTLRDRRARELVGHDEHVFGTVFSGDGELLVTSAPWGDTIVWDALRGTSLYRTRIHLSEQFAFDHGGESLFISNNPAQPWYLDFDVAQPWYGGPGSSLNPPAKPRLLHSWYHEQSEARIQGETAPFEPNGLHIFRTEHRVQLIGGQGRAFVDGEEITLPSPHIAPDLGPHPQLVLGPGRFKGSIAELIVFRGRLSETDAAAVDAYLTTRRTGASVELPAFDSALAHFRADDKTVERGEGNDVQSWAASNDSSLVLGARGGPRRFFTFVPAAVGLPAHVQFQDDRDGGNWLEMPLPQARSSESITVCWLGGYETRQISLRDTDRSAYSIETLDVLCPNRDERIVKTGPGGARSADGRYDAQIVPGTKLGGPVVVREVTTGYCVANFDDAEHPYYGISFHPDSRRLACGRFDGTIDIFDVETQELVRRIEAHTSQCFDVAFSPDGKLLASAGNDNALRLWDAETYEPLLELPGHRSYVRCLNWSSDGSMLVSGSGDYGVRIWDATPRSERYAQLLANRELEREVSPQVLELHSTEGGDREAVAEEIRLRFRSDPARRRAALKVLAQLE
ncbi:MAG: serine/threonine protein kinase/WD40 repeat protein [Planctomycetota bacterium]|jgi:serine/threonine protein kinase/WD40 repeat protein